MPRASLHRPVLDATMRCLERWGVAKTTLDDVAREAGCSRATVYRLFPGGKDSLLHELAAQEVQQFFASIDGLLAQAADVEEFLEGGIREALRQLRGHPALSFLMEHEPASVLPHPASRAMSHVIDAATGFLEPRLDRWLDATAARRAADWVVRLTLSYATVPPTVPRAAPGHQDDAVRHLVRELLAPAIQRLATTVPATAPIA
ncbi:MAG TPA: TetR/AcrR family transcriptional regulator [Acidimicrobiales bacterium]|nr:TetR/AcrR family transcriptional regulator [Acidimicrobiales bacterium]